jgi:hypothetical protein
MRPQRLRLAQDNEHGPVLDGTVASRPREQHVREDRHRHSFDRQSDVACPELNGRRPFQWERANTVARSTNRPRGVRVGGQFVLRGSWQSGLKLSLARTISCTSSRDPGRRIRRAA